MIDELHKNFFCFTCINNRYDRDDKDIELDDEIAIIRSLFFIDSIYFKIKTKHTYTKTGKGDVFDTVYEKLERLKHYQLVNPKPTDKVAKARRVLKHLVPIESKTFKIEVRSAMKKKYRNLNGMDVYTEISFGNLAHYDSRKKDDRKRKKTLIYQLVKIFGAENIQIKRLDIAFDFMPIGEATDEVVVDLKKKHNRLDYRLVPFEKPKWTEPPFFIIRQVKNTTYYNFPDKETVLLTYNKSVKDRNYEPISRLELVLREDRLQEYGLSTIHYSILKDSEILEIARNVTELMDDTFYLVSDNCDDTMQFKTLSYDHTKSLGYVLMHFNHLLLKGGKYLTDPFSREMNNFYKSSDRCLKVIRYLKRENIDLNDFTRQNLYEKDLSINKISKALGVHKQTTAKAINFIQMNDINLEL